MKRLTKEDIDKIIKATFPGAVRRASGVADLIRLVKIERMLVPRKIKPRKVIWQDYLD